PTPPPRPPPHPPPPSLSLRLRLSVRRRRQPRGRPPPDRSSWSSGGIAPRCTRLGGPLRRHAPTTRTTGSRRTWTPMATAFPAKRCTERSAGKDRHRSRSRIATPPTPMTACRRRLLTWTAPMLPTGARFTTAMATHTGWTPIATELGAIASGRDTSQQVPVSDGRWSFPVSGRGRTGRSTRPPWPGVLGRLRSLCHEPARSSRAQRLGDGPVPGPFQGELLLLPHWGDVSWFCPRFGHEKGTDMAHLPKLRRGPRRRRAAAAEDGRVAMESLQESLERLGELEERGDARWG